MAGAFGLIFDQEGKVLLAHRRDHDLWNLPGGGVEDGETPWDAVVREIKEETGLEAEIVRLEGLYYKSAKQEMVYSFLCEVAGEPTLSDEADQIEYFDLNALPANLSESQRERILDSAQRRNGNPEGVILKVQDGKPTLERLGEGREGER